MNRRATWCSLLLLGAALSLAWRAPDSQPKEAADKPKLHTAQQLRTKLALPVSLDKGIDPGTPLKEALEFLGDRYDFTILVNAMAFKIPGGKDKENVLEQHVQLPRLIGVRLSTVLSMLSAQINGTFLVHNDHIELTTFPHTRAELWSSPIVNRGDGLIMAQMVDADFDRRPLAEGLHELADQSGINVVLDARAGEKARTEVTATLSHVPVDTAVQVLADMAGLKSLAIDNVIYVTAKANAKTLQKELEHRRTGE
jgi:hypothetical protein